MELQSMGLIRRGETVTKGNDVLSNFFSLNERFNEFVKNGV
jgi:hypothetical protein